MLEDRMDYIYYRRSWEWQFWPSIMASNDPHFDGKDGVGGVTGMGVVKIYLEDKKTDLFHDIFRRVLRQNTIVITHEGAHSLLIFKKKNHKVALRHDDYSGHKAGDMLNFSTAEVHDRHSEGRFVDLKPFRVWDWRTLTLVWVRGIKIVDIDDLV